MTKELISLVDLEPFDMVGRPRDAKKLQVTWTFKRNQFRDGTLRKYKTRLFARDDQQIDSLDVFNRYAPVVSWITVHLLLVISLVFNLATQYVDYINAFCQAPLQQTVFIELPIGFEYSNKVLLLK